ncbi:MAG: hypothetical protein V9E99_07255 [Microthrixaceae bacterium]
MGLLGHRRRRWARTAAAGVLSAAAIVGGCAPVAPPDHEGGVDPDLVSGANDARYTERGPYDVGVLTVEIQRGRKMEVWYPAVPQGASAPKETYFIRDFLAPGFAALLRPDVNPPFSTDAIRGAAPAAAPGAGFPLVLFSHGAMSFRLQSTFLTTHLASWGFVVMSPDYFERGLQSLGGTPPALPRTASQVTDLAMTAMTDLSTTGSLADRVDLSRLFPIGHSAGGFQSTDLADRRVDVSSWIAMSAGAPLSPTLLNPFPQVPAAMTDPDAAAMWITGRDDEVALLATVRDAYRYTAGERKLVVVPRAGHNNAMTDICEIGREDGGLIGIARSGGLPVPDAVAILAEDGCDSPPNFLGPEVWPVVRHFVTAELRYRAGLDAEPVGLGSGVVSAFGPAAPEYEHAE